MKRQRQIKKEEDLFVQSILTKSKLFFSGLHILQKQKNTGQFTKDTFSTKVKTIN